MDAKKKFLNSIKKNNSLVCLGLDPDMSKLPSHLKESKNAIFEFNKAIIDATYDIVATYKPNIAFYEALGIDGLKQLKRTLEYLKKEYSEIPIILDMKRGDIGNTAAMYAKAGFEYWGVDAVTIYPYLGLDAVLPFLKYEGKLTILLIKTSNPDSGMFQDMDVNGKPFHMVMAEKISTWKYDNISIFVGATYPEELKKIRKLFPNKFFLSAGLGAQQGDLGKAVMAGIDANKGGIVFNATRSILYASNGKDFAEKAREEAEKLRLEINKYRV